MNYEVPKPSLVEPGMKYFLNETLDNCSNFKKKYYNNMLNLSIGIGLITIIGIFLYYKYKGKPSPSEKMLKERNKQHYILSKIKNYQDDKRRQSQLNITGLPSWENEYDKL